MAPACWVCELPLTDNDRDAETGGYWGQHFNCLQELPEGRYIVVSPSYPATWGSHRFEHRRAAIAKAEELERWNRGHKFFVGDAWPVEQLTRLTGLKGQPVADIIERFYGDLERWPVEPDGINHTRAQALAVCEHITQTGDCLWHAQYVVLKWPTCNCSNCRPALAPCPQYTPPQKSA